MSSPAGRPAEISVGPTSGLVHKANLARKIVLTPFPSLFTQGTACNPPARPRACHAGCSQGIPAGGSDFLRLTWLAGDSSHLKRQIDIYVTQA